MVFASLYQTFLYGKMPWRREIFLLVTWALILIPTAQSQQDPHFTQYAFNMSYYNPSYVGVNNYTQALFMHRSQWIGYQSSFGGSGAPSTQLANIDTRLQKINSGIGFYVINDNLGPQNNIEAKISYAYHLKLGQNSKLSFGIRSGVYVQTINFELYRAIHPDDPLLAPSGNQTEVRPDLGAGIFFSRKNLYAGISASHLIQPQFDFGVNQRNALATHLYATAGYFYDVNFNLRLQLASIVKTDLIKTSFDITALAYFKKILWGGFSFRQSEAIILMLGYAFLKTKSLKFGYALDYIIERQQAKEATSHEFMLIYEFPLTLANEKKIIRTPRYRH